MMLSSILMNPAGRTPIVKLGASTNIPTNPAGQTTNVKLGAPTNILTNTTGPSPKRRRIRHGFGI
jgi:hypothetical protein